MCRFSESNRKKLGNTVLYIAQRAKYPYKTEILKLLFLMEERSVQQYHVPTSEAQQAGAKACGQKGVGYILIGLLSAFRRLLYARTGLKLSLTKDMQKKLDIVGDLTKNV